MYRKNTARTSKPASETASNPLAQPSTLTAQINVAAQTLLDEVQAGRSDRMEALLRFSAAFHHYSIGNQMLIATQCPEATRVAGYRTWERLGYHVARGQHGIRILAPRTYTTQDDNGDDQTRLFFASVPVFDVSQLNPDELAAKPLPAFYIPLGDDHAARDLGDRVVAAMTARGIVVEVRDDLPGDATDGVQGYSQGGRVVLRAGLPAVNRLRTLVHEFAHELLHTGENRSQLSKTVKECQAEATAYVVMARYGIHNPLTSDYVQNWGADAATLMENLAHVQQAAHIILTALEGKATEADDTTTESAVA